MSSVSGVVWGHKNYVHIINNKVQRSTFFLYMNVHFLGGGGCEGERDTLLGICKERHV